MLIYLPFLTPIVLAAALAVVFGPVYRFFLRKLFKNKESSSLASLLTVVIITFIIFVPGLLISGKIYTEVQNMYAVISDEGGRSELISSINTGISNVTGLFGADYSVDSLDVTGVIQKGLEWIFGNLDTIFSATSRVLLGTFIMFLALFYFIRDGSELKRQIVNMSPLVDRDDERIFKKLEQTVYSIFAGSIIVALIQGILTGIGFAIFGVPSPALWGSIAAITALIPGIGTALIIIPGVLYLFFTGATGAAIGLLIWGIVAVGLVDNFLGPMFINRGIKIHPFLILLSVLGGIIFFGPIGLILGPLVLAFLFSLLEIYKNSYSSRRAA